MPDTSRYPYVHVTVPADDVEIVSDQLWTADAQGIEERDASTMITSGSDSVLLVASFADEEAARRAMSQLSHPAQLAFVEGDGWKDAWREYFHVTPIGKRLLLRPSWRPLPETHERVVLEIDPGGAFGSGIHETTRLVMMEIDECVRGGETVLDVGCGSGILAVAALLLGASDAYGTDIDPHAIPVSIENAEINKVDSKFRADTTDIRDIHSTWDLVLANIQAPILIDMAPHLARAVKAGGRLVLSGILAGQDEDVRDAMLAQGLTYEKTTAENDWRAVVMTRAL